MVDYETLALIQDIDLKSLVYEAYYKGAQELLFVVPFVAKVLESCAKSKVSQYLLYMLLDVGQMPLQNSVYGLQ